MVKFKAVIQSQQDLHHRISRTVENFKKVSKDKMTPLNINTRLEMLEGHWKSFQSAHSALVSARTEEWSANSYFKDDFYEVCETSYFANKDKLLELRQKLLSESAPATKPHDLSVSPATRSAIARALPKISLPKFAGDYRTWLVFRDLFRSMIINNSDITSVEKLHYLKNHVTGEAARRITNIAITDNNFDRAWEALVTRYDNKRVLVCSYLELLFSITSVSRKSSEDLKELLATVHEAISGLRSLDAPVDSWDYFLVYFIVGRLDIDSRKAWELQQGSITEPATFAELEAFLDG
ncbi:uncharacterized protein LOC105286056 [Ooceraea biroi]|nr:uncharacterized protein LOC105286056 [Ooceraea biroi]